MSKLQKNYPESNFGGFSKIDGTVEFYNRVNALLEPEFTVLDVGCGRGEYLEDTVSYRRDLRVLRGKVKKVIGIDVDPVGEENKAIDEFRLMQLSEPWPIDDEEIDLIVCDWVVEHIPDISVFLSEVYRVLKKDGIICIRTSNRLSYFAIASSLIPNKYHAKVLSKVQDKRKEEDVFPTYYKANTFWKLRKEMKKMNFYTEVYTYESEPSYLNFSNFVYSIGVVVHSIIPKYNRTSLMAFGRKL